MAHCCEDGGEPVLVYVTTRDRQEARVIGSVLVEERLAACVNIFDGMLSLYRWEGRLCEETEAVMLAKTRSSLFEQLTTRIRSLHSYTCPCIICIPMSGVDADFLQWICSSTTDAARDTV